MSAFRLKTFYLHLCIVLTRAQVPLREVWCETNATDCYFTLIVDYGLTMMNGEELVKAKNGRLYRFDTTDYNNTSHHIYNETVTGDGYYEPRLVMTYNGTIPGPALHVQHGQRVHLRVFNRMMDESTSLHIHGMYQKDTPYSDGVPFVTQCPILPGQKFTQTFFAIPKGTFFYHAHSGPQMTNGLYGPFIVHPSKDDTIRETKKTKKKRKKNKLEEHILMFQGWNHDWDSTLSTMKMRWGLYAKGKGIEPTKNLAGIEYSAFLFQSGLINGKGRYYDENGRHNEAPLSVFTVTRGKSHRFRLINAGNIHPFRVSVDSHKLKVVASDGHEIYPKRVESLIINPGERFDVIIKAYKKAGNYWIRGQTLQVGHNNTAEAILRYEGAPQDEEPTSSRMLCTLRQPCIVLNCPFTYFPRNTFTKCINFDQIRSAKSLNLMEPWDNGAAEEHFLNFAFPGIHETPGSVNGKSYAQFPVAALSQPFEADSTCSKDDCVDGEICHCPYSISLKHNNLVQLVFLNMGSGRGWDHPIHMHGHSFQVIKMGYPSYNKTTGKFLKQNPDIDCKIGKNYFCNNATWANSSWSNGNLPGAETVFAPLKDNIIVPSGGYVVARFRADNPGLWIIHCHLQLHLTDGMVALINESFPFWPPPPPDFPTCHSFNDITDYSQNVQENGPR